MPDRVIADLIVIVHLLFVAFVVAGGILVLHWPRLAWLHLPAVAWGAYAEFSATICPLTPLENHFRQRASLGSYDGGFIERYLMPVLYPAGLTPQHQVWLGGVVVVVNAIVYAAVLVRAHRRRATIAVPSRSTAPPARPSP
jgi:hypothetical protein